MSAFKKRMRIVLRKLHDGRKYKDFYVWNKAGEVSVEFGGDLAPARRLLGVRELVLVRWIRGTRSGKIVKENDRPRAGMKNTFRRRGVMQLKQPIVSAWKWSWWSLKVNVAMGYS
jgi:hypothetical protein